MLYLLRSYGKDGFSILKIGYAEIINKRMNQYKTENPCFEFLGEREGGKEEELCLHLYLKSLGYKYGKYREWFLDDEEVINSFSLSLETIHKNLWKNRRKFWTKSILNSKKNTLKKRLYNTLKEKYGGDLDILDNIDINNLGLLENFEEEMKKLVEYTKNHPESIEQLPQKYKVYFDNFSITELKNGCLRKDMLDKRLKTVNKKRSKEDISVIGEIYKIFLEGNIYTNEEIRGLLETVFVHFGLKSKATDIKLYFETSRAQITNKMTGKRDEGYKLIKRKY